VAPADSWCNGAAGIALSRMRAAELLGSATLRRDADLALAACERHVTELLERAPEDFSLCHGAAGAADVLLQAAAGREHVPSALALDVGRRGIELYVRPGAARFPGGETPGLVLGLSGIGTFYLRLFDPRVPSPLLITDPGG
jgi:lantibiotic modifying enzyme